ncbi:iron chelate uptake ABC transporter family permease subunit [Roseovarius sp. M141]|uniref:FecCD family ABC transporter permease n=1 Tax=Roseovarius sp. M141 TaxID=2583806 RepID=UPI0020CEFEA3|nr:iron chelate uptake ABC transporter family permease subunit [Roseovarius sp. M141]MCQ0091959.1 iron chelate uptake ABC transporter family permease subunit [Roseovarius sp. M141]
MKLKGRSLFRVGRISMLWRPRSLAAGCALLAAALGLALLLLATGKLPLTFGQIIVALTGESDPMATRILTRVRLPRVLTAAGVGAALGIAGAVFQSLSRNPLGSPDVIGFTTGAATGAVMQIVLGSLDPLRTAAAAVGSGMLTALVVLLLARRGSSGGGYRLVLVGIGAGAFLAGANTLLLTMGQIDIVMAAQVWLAGSLNARNWAHVTTVAVGLALFAPPVWGMARRLAVLEMGEDMARQLGIPIARTRVVLVLVAVGLSSIGTAATGPIAFIALAAPQIARRLTASPEVPLISAATTGAALLMAADLLSQAVPFGLVLPVGLTTGFLGGLYLLAVMTRQR